MTNPICNILDDINSPSPFISEKVTGKLNLSFVILTFRHKNKYLGAQGVPRTFGNPHLSEPIGLNRVPLPRPKGGNFIFLI